MRGRASPIQPLLIMAIPTRDSPIIYSPYRTTDMNIESYHCLVTKLDMSLSGSLGMYLTMIPGIGEGLATHKSLFSALLFLVPSFLIMLCPWLYKNNHNNKVSHYSFPAASNTIIYKSWKEKF